MAFQKLPHGEIRKHKGTSFTGISTVFFCHNGKGELFLTKRSTQARDEHGTWDPGAGALKHGLTLEDNVRRELLEEYNVSPLSIDFIGYRDVFRTDKNNNPTHWLAMDFAVKVDPKQVKIMEPEKVDDYGWFTLDNLPSPMHSQFNIFMQKHGTKLKALMSASS
jgi:ADP-ribose pyrophosphatase YjhB (NUDIX family)